ncbi:MAG: NUDIX hydrolase [Saprospiraceae bacterium]|nr:NUDIX hydrolase [Saprospiraceae bacterium]MCB9320277.1 NUDIX hydrolase [Lewinellaceae bacterium]
MELPFEPSQCHPGLSVDCVIFGFHENELKVLLLKLLHNKDWALPGGFVLADEDLDRAAVRVLKERTGLDQIFLRQFHTFGDLSRNLPGHAEKLVHSQVIHPSLQSWFDQRFITVGYYALVEYSQVEEPRPDFFSESCHWFSIRDLPEVMLDHHDILTKALETLRVQLKYQPIGLNLMPEKFTMPELQALYETLLEKKLDRRNFQRKMLSYDILIRTDEFRQGGAHKAPVLYAFNEEKYQLALQHGLNTIW